MTHVEFYLCMLYSKALSAFYQFNEIFKYLINWINNAGKSLAYLFIEYSTFVCSMYYVIMKRQISRNSGIIKRSILISDERKNTTNTYSPNRKFIFILFGS